MAKKKTLLVFVLIFVLLIGGAYLLYTWLSQGVTADQLSVQSGQNAASPASTAEPELTLAPDFTVYDQEGNPVQLSDYRGKPVVLNFWASWCGPCQEEMPEFNDAYAAHGEDIHFLMVNMTDGSRETQDAAEEFIENAGYDFPVYYDTDLDATMTYGVYSLPRTIFIDADGYGIAQATGMLDAETLQRGISMILP